MGGYKGENGPVLERERAGIRESGQALERVGRCQREQASTRESAGARESVPRCQRDGRWAQGRADGKEKAGGQERAGRKEKLQKRETTGKIGCGQDRPWARDSRQM